MDQPITLMAAADPNGFLLGAYLQTLIFLATSAALSALTAYGLQRPMVPKHVDPDGGAILSRRAAAGVGVGLLAVATLATWWFTWTTFKGIEATETQLTLHYQVPHRVVVLERPEVSRIVPVFEGKGRFTIVVTEQDGTQHRGAAITRSGVKLIQESGLLEWPLGAP